MSELKPCPFCGCTTPSLLGRETPLVQCPVCLAGSGVYGRESEAVEEWNRRSAEDALRAELTAEKARAERLAAQLEEVQDTLVDVMGQSCWHEGRYDTMCMSAYEGAAEYLVSVGRFVDCNELETAHGGGRRVMRFYQNAKPGDLFE